MKMKFKFKNIEDLDEFNRYKLKHGMKTSQKRLSIIDYFLAKDRHFSVEELYQEMKKVDPGIGFSTVYRTLKLLADSGIANVVKFGEGNMRFEPSHQAQHHDHLICQDCGRIIEFENDEIEILQREVARKHNFSVASHRLELYGLCRECRKRRSARKA
jgi:Fur family ferric uptake transcriptional regulator